jgi:hypothetical protein
MSAVDALEAGAAAGVRRQRALHAKGALMDTEFAMKQVEPSPNQPRGRPTWLLASLAVVTLVIGGLGGWLIRGSSNPSSPAGQQLAEEITDKVMRAWTTGAAVDIDAVYASDATLVLDGEVLPGSMATIVKGAIDYGNTYEQIGPASYFVPATAEADTYVSAMIKVTGKDHPHGDPLVTFFRVQNGKVVRHVSSQAACLDEGWYCTPVDVWKA